MNADDNAEDDEKVGYGRPPKHTRFKKGKSGNPKGRPRHSRNLATIILAELDTMIIAREGGREVKITKAEAVAKSAIAKAMKGDMRALSFLQGVVPERFTVTADATTNAALSDHDAATLNRYVARELQKINDASPKNKPTDGKMEEDPDS